MKYLSQTIIFKETIIDAAIISGTEEGGIDIDFGQLTKSDEEKGTKYVVGGRTYFEATLFGEHTTSFTTKGFFDKEGYVEPTKAGVGSKAWEVWLFVILGLVIGIILIIVCCKYCGKKSYLEDDN